MYAIDYTDEDTGTLERVTFASLTDALAWAGAKGFAVTDFPGSEPMLEES